MSGFETNYISHYEVRSYECQASTSDSDIWASMYRCWPCTTFDDAERRMNELRKIYSRTVFEIIAVLAP